MKIKIPVNFPLFSLGNTMAYGRSKVPPPATPFEEFMATASERMTAARLEFVEFLRELPPAAWITVGAVVVECPVGLLARQEEASTRPPWRPTKPRRQTAGRRRSDGVTRIARVDGFPSTRLSGAKGKVAES